MDRRAGQATVHGVSKPDATEGTSHGVARGPCHEIQLQDKRPPQLTAPQQSFLWKPEAAPALASPERRTQTTETVPAEAQGKAEGAQPPVRTLSGMGG